MQMVPILPVEGIHTCFKRIYSTDAELYGEKAMEPVRGNPVLLLLSYIPETSGLGSICLPQIAKRKGYCCSMD
ncbi:hypothetical protein F383_14239 [Gossypium arboreum]|uniref:Uncharacterized protein n=1 Tax=Gossypium arboreum TaxID=29729 RepID=A0A0B0N5B8_GOSAR|nr:hypothetical protein F383_14239 [Gossypium arboreum]